jgi:hypothetical protein
MKNKILMLIAFATLGLTFASLAQVPNYIPTNGLVGYWPFNGNANDESGNGNHGIVTGAIISPDRFGTISSCYEFNGATQPGSNNTIVNVDNVIDVPAFNVVFTNKITISLWANVYMTNNGEFLQRRTNNNIDFAVGASAGFPGLHFGNVGNFNSSSSIIYNSWHHYVYLYDGSLMQIFCDGNLVGQQSGNGLLSNNTAIMNFGKYIYYGGYTHYFFYNGKLDDIGIWNRALTQQEITALYTSQQINTCSVGSILQNDTSVCLGSSITLQALNNSSSISSCFAPAVKKNGNLNFNITSTSSDPSGNIYHAGAYSGNVTIGTTSLSGIGGRDFFLVKYDSCGNQHWVIRGGSAGNEDYVGGDFGKGIASDASGNIYLVGRYNKICTIYGTGGTSFTAPYTVVGGNSTHQDGFLVKISPTGEVLWGATIRGGSNDGMNGVTVDPSGNPIVSAGFNGCCPSTLTGTVYGTTNSLSISSFGSNYGTGAVVKFNSSGAVLWAARVYNRDASSGALTCDANGNIYVTSSFRSWSNGTAAAVYDGLNNPYSLYNPGIGLGYLLKLSPSGAYIWGTTFGNTGNGVNSLTYGTGLDLDSNGDVWVAGYYSGAVPTFYSVTGSNLSGPASTGNRGFVVKYSSAGQALLLNTLQQTASNNTQFYSLACNGNEVRAVGNYSGSNLGLSDIIIANYNLNAVQQNIQLAGGTGEDWTYDIRKYKAGYLIAGSVANSASIGGVSINSDANFLWNTTGSASAPTVSYLWSTGDTTATINVSPTQTTTYYCTVSNGISSCTDSVTVTVNPLPTNLFTQDTIAACGSSYALSAGAGFNNYNWSTGDTTSSITVNNSGWHACTVTNSAGCTATDSVFVSLVNANILQNDTSICAGNTLQLAVSTTTTSSLSSSVLPSNLQQGLVGYWPFNGNANDESGNGNNGTVNGATLTTDRFGNVNSAYSFDGVNDEISANIPLLPIGNSNRTLVTWINTNVSGFNYNNSHPYLGTIAAYGNSAGGNVIFPQMIENNNFKAYFESGSSSNQLFSNTAINNGDWHCIVTTFNGLNVKMYIDGVLNATTSNITLITANSVFGIGYCPWANIHFQGKIDDISIYNRALTSQEITQLYNIGNQTTTYLWSTGDTSATINVTPTQTTTYYCTVSNGITSCTDSVTVMVNPLSSNLFSQDTLAACGSSYTLSAGAGYSNYNWSTGDTISSVVVNNSGWYKCTVTNSAGCTASDSVYVSLVNANILQNDTMVCEGSIVNLAIQQNNSNSASCIGNLMSPNPWPYPSAYNGGFIDLGNFGVQSNFSISMWVNPSIQQNGVSILMDCSHGGSSNWVIQSFGNSNLYTWGNMNINLTPNVWQHLLLTYNNGQKTCYINGVLSSNIYNPINYSGNPNLYLGNWPEGARRFSGLIDELFITQSILSPTDVFPIISINPLNNSTIGIWHFNEGIGSLSINSSTNQTVNIGSWYWSNTAPNYNQNSIFWSTGDTTATINVTPAQTTTYYCTVSNGIISCTDSVTVIVNPLPTNIFAQDTITACGASYTLSVGSGFSNYNWSTGATTSSITVTNSGWYKCTVSNSAGCTAIDSVYVSLVNANILQNDTTVCAGTQLSLNAASTSSSSASICSSSALPSNLQQGLVGYWPFCGNANDASGNGNNGTVYGATLTADRNGNMNKSYLFTPTSFTYIKTNVLATNIVNNFTTSVWVNSIDSVYLPIEGSQSNSTRQCVIHPVHGSCFGNINTNSGTGLYVGRNGIVVQEHSDNYVRAALVYSANLVGWHLITVVYVNKLPVLYIDGQLIKSGIADTRNVHPSMGYDNTTYANYSNSGFGVGFNSTSNSSLSFFNGKIDDICIWNRTLTSSEINQLYTSSTTYLWSTGDTTSTINVTPIQTTTYYCTVSNGISSCVDSVTVTINPLPTNIFTQDTIAACGLSYTLSADSGYSNYNWSTGDTTQSITVNNSGWYTCSVTNNVGCTASDSIYLAINALPTVTANANATTVCAGTLVTLTGGGASTYTWTGGITNGVSFVPTASTTYTVTGTNAAGCTNTATQTITVNALPTVTANATATTVCAGNTVTLTGGGANTYSWSGGITNGVSFVPTATTTYTVTGTDVNGCTNTATQTITVNALPTVTANATATTVCAGTSVTLTGGGANTYSWSGGITNGVSFVPTATTTYTVTGTDVNGCTNTATQTITVNALPTVTANASATIICAGTSVTLTGVGASTYSWSGGITNGVSFVPTATTTYTVTGTDVNGCTNTATINIGLQTASSISVLNTTNASCNPGCDGTATMSNVLNMTYSINPSVIPPIVGNVITGLCAGTTYTIIGTSSVTGCTSTTTLTISSNPLPTVIANASATTVCAGNTVTLTGGGANTYTWTGGITNGVSFVPTSTTTYTVTGTDVNGCTNTATQTITVNALPTVTANASATTVCAGTSVTLTGGGANTYSWSGGITNGVSFVPTATTTYTVTGTDVNGCTNTATQTITVNALPTVTANASATTVCAGTSVTLTGGGANTYSWSGGITNGVSFVPTATTTYTVTGTDVNGCTNTATINIGLQTASSISVLSTTNASCNAGCDGTATMSNVPNMTYSINPSVIPPIVGNIITGLCAGTTYTITGTSSVTGCTSTTSVTIGTVSGPVAPTILSSTPASCNPGCNGIVILYSPVTMVYSVSPSGPLVTGNKISALCAGTVYTVTGTDVNGCTVTTTISVGTYPNPPAPTSVVTSNATCVPGCDGVVTMSPPIDLTYTVSPGGTAIANVIEGLCDGVIYTVTGTDIMGCTATTTISVGSQTASPISVLNTTNASCNAGCDGTATMSNVLNMTYSINPSVIPPIVGNAITGLCAGTTYTITGTSSVTGCTSTTTLTISSNPLPTVTANASATTVCAGNTVTLTGGGANTYTWTGGITNGISFVPTSTTTYTVTGTDVNGCTNTATKTITVNALPILVISASKQLYCEKDTVGILTGNPIGGVWSGVGVFGNTFNPTVAGLGSFYVVYTYTATNGCTNKDSLLMKVTSCLGVDDVSDENLFSVYPNPTTSEINVKTDVQLIGSDFVLYDNAGNVLRRGKIKSANTLIKLSDYSAGVYYFTVVNPLYGKHSIKVIKK